MKKLKPSDIVYFIRWNWFYMMGAIALLIALTGIVCSLVRKDPEPDLSVVVMARTPPTEEVLSRLEDRLEAAAEDRSGDGTVWVSVSSFAYATAENEEEGMARDPYQAVADTVWFQAELIRGSSVLYLVTPHTRNTLLGMDETFFVPIREVSSVIDADTLPAADLLEEKSLQDLIFAVHLPENRSEVESSIALLERLVQDA